MRLDRIPLFPLNVVLLPGADLPLHIFEPRYREMVRDCLDKRREFGMLLSESNHIAGIGCTAEILEVAKRYDDGRMDILTVGHSPFRLLELYAQNPLLEGSIEYLEEDNSPGEERSPRELLDLYETCYTLIFGNFPRELETAEASQISYLVASKLPLELLCKQRILEVRNEAERQQRLVAYLRDWAPHLQKAYELRRQASGNGQALN